MEKIEVNGKQLVIENDMVFRNAFKLEPEGTGFSVSVWQYQRRTDSWQFFPMYLTKEELTAVRNHINMLLGE